MATPYQISDSPPTYAIALFDALEERIARLRQQLRTPHGDLTLQCRENLESPPAYTTAVAQSLQEEGITRSSGLPPHTCTRTSPLEALPPRPSPQHESLPRAKIRPPTTQQTRSTPRDRMKLTSRESFPVRAQAGTKLPLRKDLPPPARPKTRPEPRPRPKYCHYDRADNVEENIKLICKGVSWLAKKAVKVLRLVKWKYRQRRQQKPGVTEVENHRNEVRYVKQL